MAVFSACEKETEGLTYIEDYPVFTDADGASLSGSEVYLPLGQEYNYKYTATLAGEDVTKDTKMVIKNVKGEVVQSIDNSQPGVYTISYTGDTKHNLDTWSVKRTVFVYNPEVKISCAGTYALNMQKSYRDMEGAQKAYAAEADDKGFSGACTVELKELCPGFYKVSDLIGGWYDQLRGYMNDYPGWFTMDAYVSLNENNGLDLLSSSFYYSTWGASQADGLEASYDPEKKRINMAVEVEGWKATFFIEMNLK